MGSVIFFKTRSPVEPVSFVTKSCRDTAGGKKLPKCRFVKRLTPITLMDKATERGLEDVAQKVLAPHFHGAEQTGKKVSTVILHGNDKSPSLGSNACFLT